MYADLLRGNRDVPSFMANAYGCLAFRRLIAFHSKTVHRHNAAALAVHVVKRG
jgi:hypothetical protein